MDDELRQFLEGMRQETVAQFAEMRRQMETRFGQVDDRFVEMRQENDAQFVEMRRQMETRFGQVDDRFVEMRQENNARFIEMRRHFDTVIDQVNGKVATLAEAMTYFDEKLERRTADIREEMRAGFSETQSLIRFAYTDLDRRVRVLEKGSGRQ